MFWSKLHSKQIDNINIFSTLSQMHNAKSIQRFQIVQLKKE